MMRWYNERGARRILCVTPNGLRENWLREAAKFELPLLIKFGGRKKGAALSKAIADPYWQVFVVNYEALLNGDRLREFVAAGVDGLVLDESHRVKNRTTATAKACRDLASAVKQRGGARLALTGTPLTKNPLDVWSQFDVLCPSAPPRFAEHPLKFGSYRLMERELAIITPHPRLGMKAATHYFPAEKIQLFRERLAPHVFQARLRECVDLPAIVEIPVVLPMHDEQRKTYLELSAMFRKKIKEELLQEAAARLAAKGIKGVSPTAAIMRIRLQQVTSGFAVANGALPPWEKLPPGTQAQYTDIPSAKLDFLKEMLPDWTDVERGNKVVIFTRFKREIQAIARLCKNLQIPYVTLSGENSQDASKVVAAFQDDLSVRVFVGNYAVASEGLTLTAANYSVLYSQTDNYIQRKQALARAMRMGQKRTVFSYELLCANTVDEKIAQNIHSKNETISQSLEQLQEWLEQEKPLYDY